MKTERKKKKGQEHNAVLKQHKNFVSSSIDSESSSKVITLSPCKSKDLLKFHPQSNTIEKKCYEKSI